MKRSTWLTVISSTILLLFLLNTDPKSLPSIALVVPFVLLFGILSIGIYKTFTLYGLFAGRRFKAVLVGAAIPVVLLVLQSLGQLTIRDVMAIAAFFIVVYFYMSRFGVQST